MNLDFTRIEIPELIIMAAAGLAVLLFGYRIKKIGFFIIWFLLGLNLTVYLLPWINSMVPQIAGNSLWQSLLPIAGGLLLGLLGFSIEKLCLGGIVFVLAMLITVQYFGSDIQTLAIGGVIGIVLAGVAVMMMKPAIIVATAITGAYALTSCILKWGAGNIDAATFYFPILIGLSIVGAIFQFATSKGVD
ncbi:DUF4203 domain-containing protein [Candidatus Saccharibacteria bacterium]|nr:DUF4203 domain-containing protein [Candidatus Saccharibacteria bacterium]